MNKVRDPISGIEEWGGGAPFALDFMLRKGISRCVETEKVAGRGAGRVVIARYVLKDGELFREYEYPDRSVEYESTGLRV